MDSDSCQLIFKSQFETTLFLLFVMESSVLMMEKKKICLQMTLHADSNMISFCVVLLHSLGEEVSVPGCEIGLLRGTVSC